MGVLRGIVPVPYGRRGAAGPTEATIGGPWPFTRCPLCDGWIDPKTGEHAKTMSLREMLRQIQEDSKE